MNGFHADASPASASSESCQDYPWTDTAIGDVSHRNNIQRYDLIPLPDPPLECYAGMFRFREEYRELVKKTGSVRGASDFQCYADHLWFDIDNDDLEKAKEGAILLLNRLEMKFNLSLDLVQAFFSGCKGFHFGIPTELFGAEPRVDLPRIFKRMAIEVARDIKIDTAIYEKNRLWRIPNSINDKSRLHKIPITADELCRLGIDQIKEMAATKRELSTTANSKLQTCEGLTALYNSIISDQKQPQAAIKTDFKPVRSKPCIEKLFEGACDGKRNESAIRLASHLKKDGCDKDKAVTRLLGWDQRNDPPLGEHEISKVVESAYTGEYDYGCNDSLLKSLCDDSCPMYKPDDEVDTPKLLPFKFTTLSDLKENPEELILACGEIEFPENGCSGVRQMGVMQTDNATEPLPDVLQKAQLAYLFCKAPPDWYDLAEAIGENARIVHIEGDCLTNPGGVKALMALAKGYLDYRLGEVDSLPEHKRLGALFPLLPYLLTVDKYRKPVYIGNIKKQFGVTKKIIEGWLEKCMIDSIDTTFSSKEDVPEFTDGELAQAEELLKSPNLLDRFLADTEKLGCVGEDDNKKTIFLGLTSRLLNDPISLIVKGESSGGKSFQVQTVARFFPKGEVLEFSALTPKALYYRKDDLAHKGLVIYERHGAEESDYSIRTLQSEKKLILSTVTKNEETGEHETVDIEIKGPVAYVETTTESHIHAENETRCFEIFVDESEEQTKKIFAAQHKKYTGEILDSDAIVRPWQALQHLLMPLPVKIPFSQKIKFPSKPVRVRRDHNRFLTLIEVIAFIHQKQREEVTINGIEYIVANYQDYDIARKLAGRILSQTIKGITQVTEELIAVAENLKPDNGPFTRVEIQDALQWKLSKTKKYLKDAVDAGYIEMVDCQRGKAFIYKFKSRPDDNANLLLSAEELQARMEGNDENR